MKRSVIRNHCPADRPGPLLSVAAAVGGGHETVPVGTFELLGHGDPCGVAKATL